MEVSIELGPRAAETLRPVGAVLGIPEALLNMLELRGFNNQTAEAWLKPTLKSLRDPLSLKHMDLAVARLVKAFDAQESIVLYGDYDLDGTSGLALALTAFSRMGFNNVQIYQPDRLKEGYGLHSGAITRLKEETGCSLIVSIDLGITALDPVEHATSLGIDVIVTDHHLPQLDADGKPELPKALAVVNPNRGDCSSGLGHLCGTGVIFYLVLALRRALLEEGRLESPFDPKELLDCFAIGTITDLVPLEAENRVLVKHGLLRLMQTDRPGLRELLKALEMWGRPLNAQDVGIRFAPKLNALSRMGAGVMPIQLYIEKSAERARDLVTGVLTNNQERQSSQRLGEEEAARLLKIDPPKHAIVLASPLFHRGIVGLVATRLCSEYNLPAFVGAIEGEAGGSVFGSARLPNGSSDHLLEAMASARSSLEQFGGHAMAAGFETRVGHIPKLRLELEDWFMKSVSINSEPQARRSEWTAASHCRLIDLNSNFMEWLDQIGPYGAKFPVPRFIFSDCLFSQVRTLKGGHAKLKLSQVTGGLKDAIWFSPPAGACPAVGERGDVLAEVQWNYYQGQATVQLMVSEVRLLGL